MALPNPQRTAGEKLEAVDRDLERMIIEYKVGIWNSLGPDSRVLHLSYT